MPRRIRRSGGETLESMTVPPVMIKRAITSTSWNEPNEGTTAEAISILSSSCDLEETLGGESVKNRSTQKGTESSSNALTSHLRVINVHEGDNIRIPSLNSVSHQLPLLYRFYHHEWDPETENESIAARKEAEQSNDGDQHRQRNAKTEKHGKYGSKRSRSISWRSGTTLSAETWLNKVPHVVWGSAMSLPNSTRLCHPCIASLHSKLITVTSKVMSKYFLKTFPPMMGSESCFPPSSIPYVLLVHYSVNPVYVNHCRVEEGRSCLVRQGDVISFLESAFDSYGGIFLQCSTQAHDSECASVAPSTATTRITKLGEDDRMSRMRKDCCSSSNVHEIVDVDESDENICSNSVCSLTSSCASEEPLKVHSSFPSVTSTEDAKEEGGSDVGGFCMDTMRFLYCKSVMEQLFSSINNAVLDGDEWWTMNEEDLLTEVWQWKKHLLQHASDRPCEWGHLFNVGAPLQWKIPLLSKKVLRYIYRHAQWKIGEQLVAVRDIVLDATPEDQHEDEDEEEDEEMLDLLSPIVEHWRVVQVPAWDLMNPPNRAVVEETRGEECSEKEEELKLKHSTEECNPHSPPSLIVPKASNSENEQIFSCIELVPAALPVYLVSHEDAGDTMDYNYVTCQRRPWLFDSMAAEDVYYYEDDEEEEQKGEDARHDPLFGRVKPQQKRGMLEHVVGKDQSAGSTKCERMWNEDIEKCWIDYSDARVFRRRKKRRRL